MSARYAKHGISFIYPPRWELAEQAEPGQVTITISSPGTSFLTLCLFTDRPEPAEVAEAALDAFREEYPELDVYRAQARVGKRSAVAWDVEFFCLEMTNSARVRAFKSPRFTGLLLWQGTDAEFEQTDPMFEKIARSVRCVEVDDAGDEPEE
ncbi:MAG: hypothetical protein NT069_34880 [Planctomycetota bacterium]|nr:hypothetical protein [Planctomycetota bacterium]